MTWRADIDILLTAVVGAAVLGAVLAAAREGKTLAIANKEPLVVAGESALKLSIVDLQLYIEFVWRDAYCVLRRNAAIRFWIPAFAGMTVGAGMTREGGNDKGGRE